MKEKLDVLVVGGGGREHALCWKIKQSPLCGRVLCAPGNPGIADLGVNCISVVVTGVTTLVSLAEHLDMDLVIVGPEASLAAGLADALQKVGIACFGPSQYAAQLESSKWFAKTCMIRAGIPTAFAEYFTSPLRAAEYVRHKYQQNIPIVLKKDGLCAGKGVRIPANEAQALVDVVEMMSDRSPLLVEHRLGGDNGPKWEFSLHVVTDGERYIILPLAQDFKRRDDGDKGPNTGGMGAYCPVPFVTQSMMAEVGEKIVAPILKAMRDDGHPYVGVLYVGCMLTEDGVYIIEFNCRFGDPETQVVLPAMHSGIDFLLLLHCAASGQLPESGIIMPAERCAVGVVMASGGYPEEYETGKVITGLSAAQAVLGDDGEVFHAGTVKRNGKVETDGGRNLTVIGYGETLAGAAETAYQAVERINFSGAFYRKDICRPILVEA